MNASSKTLNASAERMMGAADQMSTLERALLVIPLLGGIVFGILPLFFPVQAASLFGFAGRDIYLSRLSGAVTLGYVPGLLLAMLQGEWTQARLVVVATLVFNLGSLFAIGVAIFSGTAQPVVYAILVASILIVAITAWMLNQHRGVPRPAPDIAQWLVYLLVFLTVAAFGTGVMFTFAPVQVARMFGFAGNDEFVYRQGGAALLGFFVMGVLELRSRAWREIRLPSMNALLFNGASFVATLVGFASGDPVFLLLVVLVVSLIATVGSFLALVRQGK